MRAIVIVAVMKFQAAALLPTFVLVAQLALTPASADVLGAYGDFRLSECGGFFYEGVPPQGFHDPGQQQPHLRPICQKWAGSARFATLYNTRFRIPVFSAYTSSVSMSARRAVPWKVEPKLSNPTSGVINQWSSFTYDQINYIQLVRSIWNAEGRTRRRE